MQSKPQFRSYPMIDTFERIVLCGVIISLICGGIGTVTAIHILLTHC